METLPSKPFPLRKLKRKTGEDGTRLQPKKIAKESTAIPYLNHAVEKLPTLLNHPPTQILDMYVFGEGSAGELGLGAGIRRDVMDAMRPRLNQRLAATSVGIVQVAVGGMHCAALTHDNKIFTWGVNDAAALGRETDEGLMVDIDGVQKVGKDEDADSNSDSSIDSPQRNSSGLNASEAEPRQVDRRHFPEGTSFAQLVAADSATFALTATGLVYGWGTFRVGFSRSFRRN